MRWYLGYPVLAAGLVFGAQTLFPREHDAFTLRPASIDQNSALARVVTAKTDAETPHSHSAKVVAASDVRPAPRSRLATFSPGARLLDATLPPPAPGMFDFIARSFGAAVPQPHVALTASVEPTAASSWKSAVVHVAADPRVKTKPAGVAQKALLARDIQRELQRVGCYLGEIDGIWGPGSQRAVMAFMERVNAVLPVDEPDVFMLSLLATENNAICGTTCPHGQILSAGGRCLPTTLLAHDDSLEPRLARGPTLASRTRRDALEPVTAQDPDGAWTAVVADAAEPVRRPPPLHGRMGIGGPRPDDAIQPSSRTSEAILPIASNRLHRTASLEPSSLEPWLSTEVVNEVREEVIRPVTAVVPERRMAAPTVTPRRQARERAAERPRAVKSSRKNWRSNYRQVQHLFEHPLGRM